MEAIKARYPNARVYGETEAGGLGVIMVLPDDPEVLDLPANPAPPLTVNTWQKVVQPVTLGLTGLSVVVTGIAAVIARRNHMQELRDLHSRTSQDQDEQKGKHLWQLQTQSMPPTRRSCATASGRASTMPCWPAALSFCCSQV